MIVFDGEEIHTIKEVGYLKLISICYCYWIISPAEMNKKRIKKRRK